MNLPNMNLVQENTRRNRKGKKEKRTKVITQLPGFKKKKNSITRNKYMRNQLPNYHLQITNQSPMSLFNYE